MDISFILIALGLLIFFAHIFSAAFAKTRIPSVLLLMIIGLILGPISGLISPDSFGTAGSVFTTITLICILFQSGTTLDLKVLGKSIGPALLAAVLNFIVITGISILLGTYFLHIKLVHSCFLGAALGGTSSAVVIPMVNQLRPSEKAATILNLEAALSDIICLIIAMSLLESFGTGDVNPGEIALDIFFTMLVSYTIGGVAGYAWIIILKKWLVNIKNSMFTTFALAFIVYGLTNLIGMNGGMAILTFGLAVANFHSSPLARKSMAERASSIVLNDNDRNFYSEIVFILQTYFFVYIGISIRFNNWLHILIGAIFTALMFGTRYLTMSLMGKKGMTKRDRRLLRVLGPKGLVAAVLASLPLQWAQATHQPARMIEICQSIQNVAYAVVLFSIITCSVIIILTEKKADKEEQLQEPEGPQGPEPLPEQEVTEVQEVKAAAETYVAPETVVTGELPQSDIPSSQDSSDFIPE
ncbi:MAG: cation:proton antiporter [Bacteroidales bacterium]|nr:cation:proton antiporter [Bacteroidales bacterium]